MVMLVVSVDGWVTDAVLGLDASAVLESGASAVLATGAVLESETPTS